jgi:hypothetical protein
MTNGGVPNDPDETRPDQPPPPPPPLLRPYGASNVPESLTPPPPPPPSMAPVVRPPAPPPGYAGYRTMRTSGLAIASLVLGIVWIFWLGSILAVIFGHVALSQIKRSMGALTGRGMAIAGLILGYLGIVTLVGFIAAAAIIGPEAATAAQCALDRNILDLEEREYFADNGHYTDVGGLEEAGYHAHDSDLHSVTLSGGGPSNATGYGIVNEDRCD